MSEEIHVRPLGAHAWAVELVEGTVRTQHRVLVSDELLDDLGMPTADADDEERLVRESFAFLLEREKSTSVLPEFPLEEIASYFPEYPAAIRERLAGP